MNTTPSKTSLFTVRGAPIAALLLSAAAGALGAGGCMQPERPFNDSCPEGTTLCGDRCVNTNSDAAHCGSCNNVCTSGTVCSLGSCSTSCGSGLSLCGSSCVDNLSDIAHCGSCGTACEQGEACSGGQCVCPAGVNCDSNASTDGSAGGTTSTTTGGGSGTSGGTTSTTTGGTTSSTGGSTSTGGEMSTGGDTSAGGGSSTGGTSSTSCTNIAPPYDPNWPDATCEKWANETTECNADWFLEADYCAESCGRCESTGGGGTSGGGNGGGSNTGGSNNNSGGGSSYGEGNPWGGVDSNAQGWASRYWDCCKQSCGWSANAGGNPVRSCDASGANVVGDNEASACDNGSSTTCNSFAPWAYSDEVSFGFTALHWSDAQCGTCYHVEFTGTAQNGGNGPGAAALAGKTMIVMVTNTGGDVDGGQMDFLIPGGGTGNYYGCDTAWGVQQGSQELGAQLGGLRTDCGGGDLNSIKSCVADKCDQLFGSRGLTDMYEGCMWYVNWFEAADNPDFRYEQIDCPSEITSVAY